MSGSTDEEPLRATLEEYREAHDDYRGVIDGRKHVMRLCNDGVTRLLPVEESGGEQ